MAGTFSVRYHCGRRRPQVRHSAVGRKILRYQIRVRHWPHDCCPPRSENASSAKFDIAFRVAQKATTKKPEKMAANQMALRPFLGTRQMPLGLTA
jgi:hypothetical protein